MADNWNGFDFYHHDLVTARNILLQWYNHFWGIDNGGAVILAGNTGCGKTHLAKCTHKAYLYGGSEWITEPEIFEQLEMLYRSKRSKNILIDRLRRGFPLIIDDIGATNLDNTNWTVGWKYETYWKLFNDFDGPILVNTNLKQNQLPGWLGEQAASRLLEKTVKQPGGYVDLFNVPDYRLRGE